MTDIRTINTKKLISIEDIDLICKLYSTQTVCNGKAK